MSKVGTAFLMLGLIMLLAIKLALTANYTMTLGMASFSLYPFLSLLLVLVGSGIIFFHAVHSEILTLLFLIVMFIVLMYVYTAFLGIGLGLMFGIRTFP